MIWIIASIPFWACAAFLTVIGGGGLIYGASSKNVSIDEFVRIGPVAFGLLMAGGMFALVAAKICS